MMNALVAALSRGVIEAQAGGEIKAPSECKPHHSTLEASLALFLCMGLIVSYLPQIARIIIKRTSLGFSPWFLFLGATSSASSFLNVVALQWGVIRCCRWLVSWMRSETVHSLLAYCD